MFDRQKQEALKHFEESIKKISANYKIEVAYRHQSKKHKGEIIKDYQNLWKQ